MIVESHSKVVKYFPLVWRADLIDQEGLSPGSRILLLPFLRHMSVCVHASDVTCFVSRLRNTAPRSEMH